MCEGQEDDGTAALEGQLGWQRVAGGKKEFVPVTTPLDSLNESEHTFRQSLMGSHQSAHGRMCLQTDVPVDRNAHALILALTSSWPKAKPIFIT